jgi:DNA/RNA-binding domain of Phe-tRNA-synthetase-like protein
VSGHARARGDDPQVHSAGVEPVLRAELPGLRLRFTVVDGTPGSSPPALRERLRALSDRYAGPHVLALRTQPIAHAYRAFFRQIGLDPDTTRIPSEAAAVARLAHGGFRSRDRLSDALLVAVVETGVGVWALDAAAVDDGTLGLRVARAGDTLGAGRRALPLAAGSLVVADAQVIHAVLFGPLAAGHEPGKRTSAILLFCVGVEGVPAIYLEEALWLSAELLNAG